MFEPVISVNADPSLSSVPEVDLNPDGDGFIQSETGHDSADQSGSVPRETSDVETDLLGDSVQSSVQQAVNQWVGFDPTIHSSMPDGTPRFRVDGGYALKRGKGGRKSADAGAMPSGGAAPSPHVPRETSDVIGSGPMVQGAAATMSNKQTAVFLVASVTGILSRAIGPEWAAEKDEQKGLNGAVETYLDAKGGLQITPEMGLILALSAYAVPRLATENTQSKLSRFMGWCADRVAVIRHRLGV